MRRFRSLIRFSLVAALVQGGCETSPKLPTAAEGDPPFSRVTWDRLFMAPEPGTTLRVGDVMDYRFRAFFEFSTEPGEHEYSSASLDFDASRYYESSDYWSFGTTLFSEWKGLDPGTNQGMIEAAGSYRIPLHDTFCSYFERLAVNASIGWEIEEPRQKSEKITASGLEVEVTYPVEGSENPSEPCVFYQHWPQDYEYAWGWPVEWIKVVQVDPTDQVDIFFGEGRPAPVWRTEYDEGYIGSVAFIPPSIDFDVIIPVGSTGGDQRVLVNGTQALRGAGLASHFPIPERRDFGDPLNDRWDTPQEDTWFFSEGVYVPFWGPELSLTATDRVPDPSGNPLGEQGYGRGDWWLLPIEADYELCIVMETRSEENADVDLFLVDAAGRDVEPGRLELTKEFPEGTFDQEWLRIEVRADEHLRLWVAPRSVPSADGWYALLAQECIWFAEPPLGAPGQGGGSLNSRAPAVRPAGVVRQ